MLGTSEPKISSRMLVNDGDESHGTKYKIHLKQIQENGCISNSYLLK